MIIGCIAAIICVNDNNIAGAIIALAVGGLFHAFLVSHGGENDNY